MKIKPSIFFTIIAIYRFRKKTFTILISNIFFSIYLSCNIRNSLAFSLSHFLFRQCQQNNFNIWIFHSLLKSRHTSIPRCMKLTNKYNWKSFIFIFFSFQILNIPVNPVTYRSTLPSKRWIIFAFKLGFSNKGCISTENTKVNKWPYSFF